MAKRGTLANLGDRLARKPDAVPAAAPPAEVQATPAPKKAKGDGRKGILVRARPEAWKALKMIALDREITLQDLMVEAINDVLRKHEKPPVA